MLGLTPKPEESEGTQFALRAGEETFTFREGPRGPSPAEGEGSDKTHSLCSEETQPFTCWHRRGHGPFVGA